jgi:pyruvate kinase
MECMGDFLMPFSLLAQPGSPSQRRAKIVATLGPASNSETALRELVRAGADVLRLNFSHGTQEDKIAQIKLIRKVSAAEGKPLCILGDLQGPKIRTALLKDHKPVLLEAGHKLTITPREVPGTAELVGTTFKTLAENVEQGSRILLSDGLIELRVHAVVGDDVVCEIVNGGLLGESKGINLPGIPVRVPSLTEKDAADLEFALKNDVDAIAVSFVRTSADIQLVRDRVSALGSETWLIAKLEKPQAIEHLDAILDAADGIMVARGDLGVEVPPEQVPAIQKHIINRAAEVSKPVITATQMLESMIENPRPTRAEVSDVANAIYDGTDAVMLSGESAVGKYPVESVAMMARIVLEAERNIKESIGSRASTTAAFRSPKPSAKPPPMPPTISICTASPCSPSRASPPASFPSTTPRRRSTLSAPRKRRSTASICSGEPPPYFAPRSPPPKRWSTAPKPCSKRVVMCSRARSSPSSPARELDPDRPTSSACTPSAKTPSPAPASLPREPKNPHSICTLPRQKNPTPRTRENLL